MGKTDLTWQDVKRLVEIEESICEENGNNAVFIHHAYPTEEDYYTEIATRFNKQKDGNSL